MATINYNGMELEKVTTPMIGRGRKSESGRTTSGTSPMCSICSGVTMPTDSLHPDQAQPYYMTIPVDEYDRIMTENLRMKETLKQHGINLPMED